MQLQKHGNKPQQERQRNRRLKRKQKRKLKTMLKQQDGQQQAQKLQQERQPVYMPAQWSNLPSEFLYKVAELISLIEPLSQNYSSSPLPAKGFGRLMPVCCNWAECIGGLEQVKSVLN